MSELITDAEIADGMNAAYVKAGHNAYFGNGFTAGVKFALEKSKANEMLDELKETIIDLKILRNQIEDANKTNHLFDGMSDLMGKWIDRKEQLIQQATTIK